MFLSQFKVYICSRKIMTGDRRGAPSVPGTPTTPVYLLNETTASDGKQSGSHSPKKFMSELNSIHSKLNILSFCFSQTCGQLSMSKLYAYTVMPMTVRVWLEKKGQLRSYAGLNTVAVHYFYCFCTSWVHKHNIEESNALCFWLSLNIRVIYGFSSATWSQLLSLIPRSSNIDTTRGLQILTLWVGGCPDHIMERILSLIKV